MFSGVVQDISGRPHFNGGSSDQTNFALDGFNISDPATGLLEARLNIDAVRSMDLETSRFSAGKGRGSAGRSWRPRYSTTCRVRSGSSVGSMPRE